MSVRTLFAAATVAGVCATAQPASAEIDPFIYGVVTFEGQMTEGAFGTVVDGQFVTTPLAPQAFTFRTILQTGNPHITQADFTPFGQQSTYAEYQPPFPQFSSGFYSIMTLGGRDYYFGENYDYLYRSVDASDYESFIVSEGYTFYNDRGFPYQDYRFSLQVLSAANNFLYGIDRLYNFTYEVQPGDETYGWFRHNYATPSLSRVAFTTGELRIDRVSVMFATDVPGAPTTAVPEPSAWLLLIGGFGLVGAALRGRRRLAAA